VSFRRPLFVLALLGVAVLVALPLRRLWTPEPGEPTATEEAPAPATEATPAAPAPVQLGADEADEADTDEAAPDWARFNRQVGGVAERTKPSVVYLTVVAPNAPYGDQYPTETGSGVILSREGHVITNAHVVRAAGRVNVVLNDRREYAAEIVGSDPTTDLAVLRLLEAGPDLPVARLGDSDDVQVGDGVVVVGSPLRLQSTVTFGIVSALGRQVEIIDDEFRIEDFIQTDAAINPGNSGGAMANLRGEVIGIVTAIASQSGFYEGYGFAVPSNLARRVAEDLIAYGEPRRGYLGVSIENVTAETARERGLEMPRGVYVKSVVRGGPADRAGVRAGDVLLRVGGREVNEMAQFQSRLALSRPGEAIPVVIWRGGERSLQARLLGRDDPVFQRWAEVPAEPEAPAVAEMPDEAAAPDWGVRFRDLTAEERRSFRVASGAFVEAIAPNSAADVDGLPVGTVVVAVEGRPVRNAAEARAELAVHARRDEPALLRVRRTDGVTAFYDLASPFVE